MSKYKILLSAVLLLTASCFAKNALAQSPEQLPSADQAEKMAESADDGIPNLVGTWKGPNLTISESKGYKDWEKTVVITEQKDRRFKGHFEYSEGKKEIFGIIHPDGETFTWVATGSKGFNLGRILDEDYISACYVEAGDEMTTGCAELELQK